MRIEVLGPLRVHDDEGRPVRVGGPRVRALLIALALDPGRVVPVASLVRWLWDDDPPDGGRAALHALVSRLRAALRDAGLADTLVESHAAGYRLGAELAWQRGSPAEATRLCEQLLAEVAGRQAVSWHPLRALAQARLGTLALEAGDTRQAAELLDAALATAVQLCDRPIIASVVEGLAGLAVRTGDAARAAALLGAADSVRGAVDHGSLDAPAVRGAALERLGSATLEASYRGGRMLSYDEAVGLAAAS